MNIQIVNDFISKWSHLGWDALLTVGIVFTFYLIAKLLNRFIVGRLQKVAQKSSWKWDDTVILHLRKVVPLFGLVSGLYIAKDTWELTERMHGVVNNTLIVLFIMLMTFILSSLAVELVGLYGTAKGKGISSASLTHHIVRVAVLSLGALISLNQLGISITPLLTAAGIGGLALALGLQETLSSLFAGVFITWSEQIRIGDYIRLSSGEEGYVVDISWRSTQIRMLSNNIIMVPNAKLSQTVLTNFYMPNNEMSVYVDVGVDYGSDLEYVEMVTKEVAREALRNIPGTVADYEPLVRYNGFGDSSINFRVVLRVSEFAAQYVLKHEFIKRLHRRYNEENIIIPFPIRTLHVSKEVQHVLNP